MIARSFIFVAALFSILTIVAGLECESRILCPKTSTSDNSKLDYFKIERVSRQNLERSAREAISSHGRAAELHEKIEIPEHQEASKAHDCMKNSLVTSIEDHRMVRNQFPPRNNKAAFDWHVENVEREAKHSKAWGDARWVVNLLKKAKKEHPKQANIDCKEALRFKPA